MAERRSWVINAAGRGKLRVPIKMLYALFKFNAQRVPIVALCRSGTDFARRTCVCVK